jgi:hypothetical protein
MTAYLTIPVSFGYMGGLRVRRTSRVLVFTVALAALAALAIAGVAMALLLPDSPVAPRNTDFLTP